VVPSTYHADDGAAYERFLGRWTQRLAGPFIAFAAVPADGDVLDVGCGTGSLTLALAQDRTGGRVVGIDIAEPYIASPAIARARRASVLEVGDACHLRFADGAFAGALAQLSLNFVPDAAAAVCEMRRVTRRAGFLPARSGISGAGWSNQRLFWDTAAAIDRGAAAARDRLFSHPLALPGGLIGLWQEAGLMQVEPASLIIRMDYADFDDYWQPLLGGQGPVGTYVGGLSAALRSAIQAEVRAAYLSGATDGPRSMTATAWAVRGNRRLSYGLAQADCRTSRCAAAARCAFFSIARKCFTSWRPKGVRLAPPPLTPPSWVLTAGSLKHWLMLSTSSQARR